MPTLIFIHSPLAPPSTWRAVAALAEHAGYAVRTPALSDALFHPIVGGAPYLAHCAEAITSAARGCARPILVVHSGAGLLLAAAAARAIDPPEGAIFVDAVLPQPGLSWFETAPPMLADRIRASAQDGVVAAWTDWFPPGTIRALFRHEAEYARFVAETPRLPLGFFEEPAPNDAVPPMPCAYLRLSHGYEAEAVAAEAYEWSVCRIEAHHLAMLTEPAAVWREIAALADAIIARRLPA